MYTLQNFLDEFSQHGVRLYTEPELFQSTGIESVSVQEYPLDGYKTENELVLSTIIGCETDEDRLLSFIKTIRDGGAVALGISVLGDSFIPSEHILEYCRQNKFTLFFLPWDLRFAFITKSVLAKVDESNTTIYKDLQETLLHSFLIQEDLRSAAASLYYFFSAAVRIYDENLILKQQFPDFPDTLHLSVPLTHADAEIISFPLEISGSVYGYVEVLGGTDEISTIDISLVKKYISLPLFLWFNRERAENLAIDRLRSDFLWNLVNKSYSSYEAMLLEGSRLGHDLTNPYACFAVQIIEESNGSNELNEYSEKSRRLAESLEGLIIQCRKRHHTDMFFASRGLKCLAFIDCSKNLNTDKIKSFVKEIYENFRQANPSFALRFGISEISRDYMPDFSSLCADAELALQYCQEAGGQSYYFTSKDSQFYRLVLELSRNTTICEAAENMMKELQNHDKKGNMDLKRTLITYIQCNYNQSLTARALFLNRHSLLYRIKKIEEITGMSLTNHRDLFTLEVYTRIMNNY